MTSRPLVAQRYLALVLVIALVVVSAPLLGWIVLAIWTADLSRPQFERTAKALGGHARAAGLITALFIVGVLAPTTAIIYVLTSRAIDLARNALAAGSVEGTLQVVTGGPEGQAPGLSRIAELVRTHTEEVTRTALRFAGATLSGLFGVIVFGIALFLAYVEAPRAASFLGRISPLGPVATKRMALAFRETGRGLFVGIGLTCAAQGLLATVGYAVAGVPRFLTLGVLTMFAALIPGIGLALVWIPVCAALAIAHRTNAAIGIAIYHVAVVGMADNFLRPVFARMGKLDLTGATLMLSLLGGISVLGAWGLLFGPLLVRLTIEILRIVSDSAELVIEDDPYGR